MLTLVRVTAYSLTTPHWYFRQCRLTVNWSNRFEFQLMLSEIKTFKSNHALRTGSCKCLQFVKLKSTEWFPHEMHITGQRKGILTDLSKKQIWRILIHSRSIPIYNAFLSSAATWKGNKYKGKRSVNSVCTFRNIIALPFHRHRDEAEVAVKFVRKQWFELSVGRENSMPIDVILSFVNLDHFTSGETFEFIASMKYFPSLIRARESRVPFPNAAIQAWWYGVMHCL